MHTMVRGMVLRVVLLSVTHPGRHSDASAVLIAATVLSAITQGACSVPLIVRPSTASSAAGPSNDD
ncbi:hypothetical protein ACWD04_25760 [Streptomyces sp. NPDC002911]